MTESARSVSDILTPRTYNDGICQRWLGKLEGEGDNLQIVILSFKRRNRGTHQLVLQPKDLLLSPSEEYLDSGSAAGMDKGGRISNPPLKFKMWIPEQVGNDKVSASLCRNKPDFLLYRLFTGLTEAINACFWLRGDLLQRTLRQNPEV